MKKEIAKRWVEALRSGKYSQTREYLKDDTGFCCLGVLCDTSGIGAWGRASLDAKYEKYVCEEDFDYGELPLDVRRWAGMKTPDGRIFAQRSLAGLNDGGATFGELADIIEKEWESL